MEGQSKPVDKIKKMPGEKELPNGKANISNLELLDKGKFLFDEAKYIEAIEMFSLFLGKEENDLAHQYLARCYFRLEKYNAAYNHFNYLAEHSEGEMKEYGISMIATIEEIRGNIGTAIKLLKTLPPIPRNIMNLAIMYWKKYKISKEEYSIMEARRLLRKIDVDTLPPIFAERVTHLNALIHQAQQIYKIAESLYTEALKFTNENQLERGKILNDYASLLIECKRFDEAEEVLLKAREIVRGKSELEEAYNNKWLGLIALEKSKYETAKEHLEKAVKVLRERKLIEETAGVLVLLLYSYRAKEKEYLRSCSDFYKAADYHAEILALEKLLEEVKERDEKIIDFYFDSFFGRNCKHSGVG